MAHERDFVHVFYGRSVTEETNNHLFSRSHNYEQAYEFLSNLLRNEEFFLGNEMKYDPAVELRCVDDFLLEGDIRKVFIGTSLSVTELSGRIVELFIILNRLPMIIYQQIISSKYKQDYETSQNYGYVYRVLVYLLSKC